MEGLAVYEPSPWGADFHSLTVDEALGAGAAGPGKTTVLIMEPLMQAKIEDDRCRSSNPQFRLRWGESTGWALFLRRTTTSLEQTMARARKIFKAIEPDYDWSASKNIATFKSGFRYQFGHCKELYDWEQYFSNEYSIVCFDELVQFDEEQYRQISLRVRSSDPVLKRMLKIRSMSNPVMNADEMAGARVRNPHWVRDYFVKPYLDPKNVDEQGRNKILVRTLPSPDGVVRKWRRIYKPARLDDNPDKDFVETYKRTLLSASENKRKALLEGDWWVTAGSFFAESWDTRLHVTRPFRIAPNWKRFRSMDWGYKKPGCVHWWAMDPDGNLFCTDEFWFNGPNATERKVASEIAEVIVEKEDRWGFVKRGRSLLTGPADTQLWEERGKDVCSMADDMAAKGVHWVKADKKSRAQNAQRIAARLRDKDGGQAGLVFFSTCSHAIQVVPSIQTNQDNVEEPLDGGEDHAYDSVAYAVAFASTGSVGVSAEATESDPWDPFDHQKPADRGRLGYGATY